MRSITLSVAFALALAMSACRHSESDNGDHSVAHEVGKAAYKVTKESEKVAKKAGETLKHAGKEAHEGWKDARTEDRTKHPK